MSHTRANRCRLRPAWAVVVAMVITAGCFNDYNGNGKGHHTSWSPEEREALARMDRSISLVEQLLDDPDVAPADKARLREATRSARMALSQYQQLRRRGTARATALAGIASASALIIADDATVVGVADDVTLAPLAIAAMATYMVTEAKASSLALTQAWLQVAQRIREVGTTVDDIVHRAAPGRHADTGIMAEVYDLLGRMGLPPNKDDNICRALAMLMEAAEDAKDTNKINRIRTTQKAHKCRRSRHNRE